MLLVDQAKIHKMVQSENTENHKEFLSNKDQAWQDLHRPTQDDNSDVRWCAAYAFDSVFISIPDAYKDQAWHEPAPSNSG